MESGFVLPSYSHLYSSQYFHGLAKLISMKRMNNRQPYGGIERDAWREEHLKAGSSINKSIAESIVGDADSIMP